MIIIKTAIFSNVKRPISTKLFGNNKTWRGFLVVSVVNGLLLFLMNLLFSFHLTHAFWLGFVLGVSYMLFELPNSYMKRKLGIEAGEKSETHALFFMLLDKTDSAFGVNLVYFLLGFITFPNALLLFAISSSLHISMSYFLVQLHLKKSF
ncbi:CDP-archaeol synthase [Kordia periserrulae]|nr:CDP-archaeol synthase [Kordia periserrulae]